MPPLTNANMTKWYPDRVMTAAATAAGERNAAAALATVLVAAAPAPPAAAAAAFADIASVLIRSEAGLRQGEA